MRGGLELDFEGKGLTVVLLTFVPQFFEACSVAILTRAFFGMPWTLCFSQGFCIAAVSPAVLVPSVMALIDLNRGTAKGIPQIMLAASSFDDIAAITLFSVFSTLAFEMLASEERDIKNAASGLSDEIEVESTSVKTMIGMSVFYVVSGFLLGMVFGAIMKLFNMECCTKLSHKC